MASRARQRGANCAPIRMTSWPGSFVSVQTFIKITRLASRRWYMVITCANSRKMMIRSEIMKCTSRRRLQRGLRGGGGGGVQVRQAWGYLAEVWNVLAEAAYSRVLNCGSPRPKNFNHGIQGTATWSQLCPNSHDKLTRKFCLGSNIHQNHSSSLQEVIYGHNLCQFTQNDD